MLEIPERKRKNILTINIIKLLTTAMRNIPIIISRTEKENYNHSKNTIYENLISETLSKELNKNIIKPLASAF